MTRSSAPPQFIYFDLGKVLLTFDHQHAAQQMAEVAGIAPECVWDIVFESELHLQYERGQISTHEFYQAFCEQSGSRADEAALRVAASDIFQLNTPMVPIVAQLKAAGYQLGVLSNTNESHWQFICDSGYTLLSKYFDTYALSYKIGAIKPDAEIYAAAAALANVAPDKIFFVDDREENVLGARQAGFDAVLFNSPLQLAEDLRSRGVRFNY